MITKKKVLLHILWGAIFGLISGIIVAYDQLIFAWIHKLKVFKTSTFCYDMQFTKAVTSETFRPFYENVLKPANLIMPGIFIGLTLGAAGKSLRRGFCGILGGVLGAALYYIFWQETMITILFFPGIYAVPVGLFIGLAYRSLKKAVFVMFWGIVGTLGFLLCYLAMDILGLRWTPLMGSGGPLFSTELCEIISQIIEVILISVGIFIGVELGDKKSQTE